MARGGKRAGAGRPLKRGWWADLVIGQACEVLWRQAEDEALAVRMKRCYEQETKIQTLWDYAKAIPVPQRKGWRQSGGFEDHREDMESWLHKLAGTPFDEATGSYPVEAPRLHTFSKKPPKGTRIRIIGEVAKRHGLSEATTNRLWKAYRKFEKDTRTD